MIQKKLIGIIIIGLIIYSVGAFGQTAKKYLKTGNTFAKAENYTEAIEHYTKAIELEPN